MFQRSYVKEVSFFDDYIMLRGKYFEMKCVIGLTEMFDKLYEDTQAYDKYLLIFFLNLPAE